MYPKNIELEHTHLTRLLKDKASLIDEGIKQHEEVEKLEAEMAAIDKEVQDLEAQVDVSDLDEESQAITDQFNEAVRKMEEIKKKVFARMKSEVPSSLHQKYEDTKKQKEKSEQERNKTALKIEKYKTKIIQLARKVASPYFKEEYEDLGGVEIAGDKVKFTIFSHLQDFKDRFKKKNN